MPATLKLIKADGVTVAANLQCSSFESALNIAALALQIIPNGWKVLVGGTNGDVHFEGQVAAGP